jgi:hypothetical protein
MARMHSVRCLSTQAALASHTARLCSHALVQRCTAAILCRVHLATSLQDGSTYAAKVLLKVTINKSKARKQLQSKCLHCSQHRQGSLLTVAAARVSAAGGVQQVALLDRRPAQQVSQGQGSMLCCASDAQLVATVDCCVLAVYDVCWQRVVDTPEGALSMCVHPPVRCCRCREGSCCDAAAGRSPQRSQTAPGVNWAGTDMLLMMLPFYLTYSSGV